MATATAKATEQLGKTQGAAHHDYDLIQGLANPRMCGKLGPGGITMATMNISLPDSMKDFIQAQAAKKGFGTVSEYVRSVIRELQERQAERDQIDGLLIEGLDSGPATPMTRADWDGIRNEVHKRHAARQGRTNGPQAIDRR
jgi:antitoxin ParD1/3/4